MVSSPKVAKGAAGAGLSSASVRSRAARAALSAEESLGTGQLYGVPQEMRRTVNPLRGKMDFLANETIKVNPNGGKQGIIPEKESPGIANKKSDPNGIQKELVPRRPQGNSNKNPSGSNSVVPTKSKGNHRREFPFEFYAQVQSEWAPKGNKFLSACRNFLCTVGFLCRAESEQKGNHSEVSTRAICSSGIS